MKAIVAKEHVEGDWLSTGSAAAFEFAVLACFCVLVNRLYAEWPAWPLLDHVGGSGIEGGPAMGTCGVAGIDLAP